MSLSQTFRAKNFQSFVLRVAQIFVMLLFSQMLSLIIAGTGTLSTLLSKEGVNIPTSQSLLCYGLLAMLLPAVLLFRCVSRTRLNAGWFWLVYAACALFDVEGNYLMIKAYSYTSMTSVMLLDCWTIPCVMVLSMIVLRKRYRWTHVIGVLLCLIGVVVLVLNDLQDFQNQSWKGDLFAIAGASCYAVSNIAEEIAVRPGEFARILGRIGSVFKLLLKKLRRANVTPYSQEQREVTPESPTSPSPVSQESPISEPVEANTVVSQSPEYVDAESPERHVESQLVVSQESKEQDNDTQEAAALPPRFRFGRIRTCASKHGPSLLNGFEYVSFLGFFGVIITIIQVLALERQEFFENQIVWTGTSIGLFITFGIIMFIFYISVPVVIQFSSATFLNLSLLTSDVFGVIIQIAFFKLTPSPWYFLSLVITIIGLTVYNASPELAVKVTKKPAAVEEDKNMDGGETRPLVQPNQSEVASAEETNPNRNEDALVVPSRSIARRQSI